MNIYKRHRFPPDIISPDFSPGDAMIAQDFLCQLAPATAGAKKTSEGASSAVCNVIILRR